MSHHYSLRANITPYEPPLLPKICFIIRKILWAVGVLNKPLLKLINCLLLDLELLLALFDTNKSNTFNQEETRNTNSGSKKEILIVWKEQEMLLYSGN
jgi:hypothetical protein